jgi:dihydrofolate synthase
MHMRDYDTFEYRLALTVTRTNIMQPIVDLTLSRIRSLATRLPIYTRPTCHIAGTNGKGSVSAILSSTLLASKRPLTVGRFNSPHLMSVHDSIVINRHPVGPDVYSSVRTEVERADREHDVGASSFELLTMTALLIFERCRVDVAVIEVGMGGRLDATNVIPDECILVSALSAVDLDHQAFLGPTVADIAREKAGIARRGRPFVVGPQHHAQVEDVVRSVVADRGADVVVAGPAAKRAWDESIDGAETSPFLLSSHFRLPRSQPVSINMPCFPQPISATLPLFGDHQLDNLGLACMTVSTLLSYPSCAKILPRDVRENITPESVAQGISSTSWPGRLSFHTITLAPHHHTGDMTHERPKTPLTILVDGAHNPASASTLATFLSSLFLPVTSLPISLTYIIALSYSPQKSPIETLSPVLQLALPENMNNKVKVKIAVLRFTPPDGMPWVTSIQPSELRRVVLSLVPDADVWAPPDDEDPRQQGHLYQALEWATDKQASEAGGLVALFGSLYLVADFHRLLSDGRVCVDKQTRK